MVGMLPRCLSSTASRRVDWTRRCWSLSLAVLALALAVHSAAASVGWCRSDPVVAVDGALGDVFISTPLDTLSKVTGQTQLVVSVPEGVDAALAAGGTGFGYGERVNIEKSSALKVQATGIEVELKVYVPASSNIPVSLEFARGGAGAVTPARTEGTANNWIVLQVLL
jgi:hypothetical protein